MTSMDQQEQARFAEWDELARQPEMTDALAASLVKPRSRRGVLKVAALGLGGAVAVGGNLATALPALAAPQTSTGRLTAAGDILSIARTAEQLAVTFYTNGIKRHKRLGLEGNDLTYLKAAVTEEQIHEEFLAKNGGKSLANVFSFPHGDETFESKVVFIQTLEQLETAFVAAYLAAVKEFAAQGQPGLAQIAAQICGVECEHRTLGRDIGGLTPADNVAFEQALFAHVSDAVGALSSGGFLSPRAGNRYEYHPVDDELPGVIHTHP